MDDEAEDASAVQKPRVQSVARAAEILKLVARADSRGISARAISDGLGFPRQVVYHLLHTLRATGMLRKAGRSAYVLGLGIATLAQGFRRQIATTDMVGHFADLAAQLTGETAYVVGWLEDEIVVLSTARGAGAIQAVEIPRGTAGFAHARASGKLLLSMVSGDEVSEYLRTRPPERRTPNTITTPEGILAAIAETRERGYAIDNEEYEIGLSCLAVPIGPVPAAFALGISAPSFRFKANFDRYLEVLRTVANKKHHDADDGPC